MSSRRRSHCSSAAPLDDEDLLPEILLRLPPQPSSIPRASAVCKSWRQIVSDARFLRRFREHHRRNPPLIGCFVRGISAVWFEPTLQAPNRVPRARFSFPIDTVNTFKILGCRHGLVLILLCLRNWLLVWDPVTGDQHRLDAPPGFEKMEIVINGAVLRAAGEVHHFQVVLVGNSDIQHAVASVYSSETGLWTNLVSTLLPADDPMSDAPTELYQVMCSVMVGNSLYWLLVGNLLGILEFHLDRHSLTVIDVPVGVDVTNCLATIMPVEGGGLGFLSLSGYCAQLWKRKTDDDGVASWVLGRTVALDKLLSINSEEGGRTDALDKLLSIISEGSQDPRILGFAEDNNVVLLWTFIGVFMLQFDSLQFKKLLKSDRCLRWYHYCPFEVVYTADAGTGGGYNGVKLLHNT